MTIIVLQERSNWIKSTPHGYNGGRGSQRRLADVTIEPRELHSARGDAFDCLDMTLFSNAFLVFLGEES